MKYVVKQAAEAPAEKPVEMSIYLDSEGRAHIQANGITLLVIQPDGTARLYFLGDEARALGFVTDTDCRIAIPGRIPG